MIIRKADDRTIDCIWITVLFKVISIDISVFKTGKTFSFEE